MLTVLRHIVQRVTDADNLNEALQIIVLEVRRAMEVEVCSVYLHDALDDSWVLRATEGLNASAVGQVRMHRGQGLVSQVAARSEPINLENAPADPNFAAIAGSGEEPFPSFLGVPIIQHREVLGVLVVQRHGSCRFDEEKVTFLLTIASQLAGGIAHARVSGRTNSGGNRGSNMQRVQGLPGAPGVGIGTAHVVYPSTHLDSIPDRRNDDPETEIATFEAAVEAVKQDIRQLHASVSEAVSEEERALFDAYVMMLDSNSIRGRTITRISDGLWAPTALRDTIREHMRLFSKVQDPLLKERASDLWDLGRRVLDRLLDSDVPKVTPPPGTILVGAEITATMLAEVPLNHLGGVVSVHGSQFSHTAILARALGVPCIMGATDLGLPRIDGQELILDGYRGHLYIQPTQAVKDEFRRLAQEEDELSRELRDLRDQPAETTDGHRIALYANSGLLSDINPSLNSGAEGIGLYRTEFPFMIRDFFPSEEAQTRIYNQVLLRFAPRPVTLRTLDVGGDKALPYFPIDEANPFLGWRGIRITLDHQEIFLTQLRAMLRASDGLDNLSLLLPMISCVSEVDDSLKYIDQAFNELTEEGLSIKRPRIGVMIEVPAATYQIPALARRVDFISVGTNDLTQYLLAVDRNNERVANLYDSLHPAVLRALLQIVDSARALDLPASVCGEMAGDPAAALLLVGMGYDSLSTSAASLPRIKWVIQNFSRKQTEHLLQQALEMEMANQVRDFLNQALVDAGLGGLVRAGK